MMDVLSCEIRNEHMKKGTLKENEMNQNKILKQIKIELKTHQYAMVKSMINLEENTIDLKYDLKMNSSIGVCADIAGAGKSICILSLINNNLILKPKEKICMHLGNFVNVRKTYEDACCIPSNLLIVPHSCVIQWREYIENLTELSLYVISKRKDIENFTPKDIVLCSSTMYNAFIEPRINKIWSRVIIDEADTINIANMIGPSGNFIWFITSSVQNLLFPSGTFYTTEYINETRRSIIVRKYIDGIRKTGFIRDTFRMFERSETNDIISNIFLKNSDKIVHESFLLETPYRNIVKCRTPLYMRVISGLVTTEVMEMLHAGNIQGAIEKTGINTDSCENVIIGVTKQYEQQLHNLYAQHQCALLMNYTRDSDKEKRIESLNKEIQRVKEVIETIKERISSYSVNTCPICFDIIENPTATKCCNHIFCFKCIARSLERSQHCPMCRSAIYKHNLTIISKETIKVNQEEEELPSKLEALIKIINDNKKGKFLIFSSYDQSFYKIINALKENKTNGVRLLGSGSRINKIIHQYKETNELNVLMLNSTHFGTGLNLENTSDLIFYHKMPKDLEIQVIGRAQRFGRKEKLTIHYLFQENEA